MNTTAFPPPSFSLYASYIQIQKVLKRLRYEKRLFRPSQAVQLRAGKCLSTDLHIFIRCSPTETESIFEGKKKKKEITKTKAGFLFLV